MNEWRADDSDGDSDGLDILSLGASILRGRWTIIRWALVFGVITAVMVFDRPLLYRASASFIPQGTESGGSGSLSNLASQFGVSLPSSNNEPTSLRPPFYLTLLSSQVLLQEIVTDTFTVPELDGKRISFLELFELTEGNEAAQLEAGLTRIRRIVIAELNSSERIVQVSASTPWPSVSLALVSAALERVTDYNRTTSQLRASAEREFIEERLRFIKERLRESEANMESFLLNNRQFSRSPALEFESDRLQRDITLQVGVLQALTQSYEQLRQREVRDTPVYTIFEPLSVATVPQPRGRVSSVILGLMVGVFFGLMKVLTLVWVKQGRARGDPGIEEFVSALGEIKREVLERVPWLPGRGTS